jgi:hypothetical protein
MTEYCPICDGELEIALGKEDTWHCMNCDKYFLRVIDDDESISETSQKRVYSKGKVAAVGFIVILMILGIIICGYLAMPA